MRSYVAPGRDEWTIIQEWIRDRLGRCKPLYQSWSTQPERWRWNTSTNSECTKRLLEITECALEERSLVLDGLMSTKGTPLTQTTVRDCGALVERRPRRCSLCVHATPWGIEINCQLRSNSTIGWKEADHYDERRPQSVFLPNRCKR